ncbi:helix-turn-helix transcriptional regulator [Moraxella porci]|uniref:helix-turn-helix transcriptional regulator n=1 Tax=Moraxella porci TaxID=1288392 RepID=UPI0024479FA7|nr:helix-turn-helix transcriptional regulator [Moraxella porci]MDH2272973.1 helix-turn-helix transcriptional regulator [Moraxella porci]
MLKKPDWQKIVEKLLEKRTQKELSEETGISQGTISEIKRGSKKERLSYQTGVSLLTLYDKDMQNDQT